MLNNLSIMGRITHPLELRRTDSGKSVTSFSIACERNFKSKDGTYFTDFFDCVAFDYTAEFICKNFDKGRMIAIEGHLQTRDWTDKNGNKRRNVDIAVDKVFFADSKRDTTPEPRFVEVEDGEIEDMDSLPF